MKERIYCFLLGWSIMRLVNMQKTYQARCDRFNTIINKLVDLYCDYCEGRHIYD